MTSEPRISPMDDGSPGQTSSEALADLFSKLETGNMLRENVMSYRQAVAEDMGDGAVYRNPETGETLDPDQVALAYVRGQPAVSREAPPGPRKTSHA